MNWVDFIVIGTLLFSGFISLSRGFTREILTVFIWVGAFVVAYYTYPMVIPMVQSYIPKGVTSFTPFIAGLPVFILAFIALSIIVGLLFGRYHGEKVNFLDRSLGLAFGLLRGAIVIIATYLGLVTLWGGNDNLPKVIHSASTYPIVSNIGEGTIVLLPRQIRQSIKNIEKKNPMAAYKDVQRVVDPTPNPKDKKIQEMPKRPKGYTPRERDSLEKAIDHSTENDKGNTSNKEDKDKKGNKDTKDNKSE